MKITVFTSNQPRHINLINSLADVADEVFAIQEGTTIFPGQVEDFYHKSETMQKYFSFVQEAERDTFGAVDFLKPNVRSLSLKMGDLSKTPMEYLKKAMSSDLYIVFGSSYIKGDLVDFLVESKCVNIHMGISPQYRGNSCNFWALYNNQPEYVGASIIMLSKGLDTGKILFHALPKAEKYKPFHIGMRAVKAAHDALVHKIEDKTLFELIPVVQNKNEELKYTKRIDFTDIIAKNFLENRLSEDFIYEKLKNRNLNEFINPIEM